MSKVQLLDIQPGKAYRLEVSVGNDLDHQATSVACSTVIEHGGSLYHMQWHRSHILESGSLWGCSSSNRAFFSVQDEDTY